MKKEVLFLSILVLLIFSFIIPNTKAAIPVCDRTDFECDDPNLYVPPESPPPPEGICSEEKTYCTLLNPRSCAVYGEDCADGYIPVIDNVRYQKTGSTTSTISCLSCSSTNFDKWKDCTDDSSCAEIEAECNEKNTCAGRKCTCKPTKCNNDKNDDGDYGCDYDGCTINGQSLPADPSCTDINDDSEGPFNELCGTKDGQCCVSGSSYTCNDANYFCKVDSNYPTTGVCRIRKDNLDNCRDVKGQLTDDYSCLSNNCGYTCNNYGDCNYGFCVPADNHYYDQLTSTYRDFGKLTRVCTQIPINGNPGNLCQDTINHKCQTLFNGPRRCCRENEWWPPGATQCCPKGQEWGALGCSDTGITCNTGNYCECGVLGGKLCCPIANVASGVDTEGYTTSDNVNLCVNLGSCNVPSNTKENCASNTGCNDGINNDKEDGIDMLDSDCCTSTYVNSCDTTDGCGRTRTVESGYNSCDLLTNTACGTEVGKCTDGKDNDCDINFDYAGYGTTKGDNNCPVSITSIEVNPTTADNGAQIEVKCGSSVGPVRSISASLGGRGCTFTGWQGSLAIFGCTTTSSCPATETARCYVDTSKSFATSPTQRTMDVIIKCGTCSAYSLSSSCNGDSRCDWCSSCSGNKYSGGNSRCVNTGTCSFYCDAGQCDAICDNTDTPCQDYCSGNVLNSGGTCGTGTCACSYASSRNCDLDDGWYDIPGVTEWKDYGQCKQILKQEQEYRDYSCSGTECTFVTPTPKRWVIVEPQQIINKVDGTTCDDGKTCTINDACLAGACTSATPLDCSYLDNDCTTGVCNEPGGCTSSYKPTTTSCGTGSCPADECLGDNLITYSGGTKYCDGQGMCGAPQCPENTPIVCSQTGNADGDSIECNCDCNGYDRWENPTNNNCADGKNNDCDIGWDWDTLDRGGGSPIKGDIGCKVGVTAANIIQASYCPSDALIVECTSTAPNVNSIDASLGSTNCNYLSWNGNKVSFTCSVPAAATGTLTATCSVDTTKSYVVVGQESATDTVTAKALSQCTLDPTTCQAQGGAWISNSCSGNKYYAPADPDGYCLFSGIANYVCEADLNNDGNPADAKCSAECDETSVTCPGTTCYDECSNQYSIMYKNSIINDCKTDCTCPTPGSCPDITPQSCGTATATCPGANVADVSCNKPCNTITNDNDICGTCTPDLNDCSCTLDDPTCIPIDCGNDVVNQGEQCDGGSRCTTLCRCELGYKEDPASNGCVVCIPGEDCYCNPTTENCNPEPCDPARECCERANCVPGYHDSDCDGACECRPSNGGQGNGKECCGPHTEGGEPKDEDCDGVIDEGCDLDGDGFIDINISSDKLCLGVSPLPQQTETNLIKEIINNARDYYCSTTDTEFCTNWKDCSNQKVEERSDNCKRFCHRYGC